MDNTITVRAAATLRDLRSFTWFTLLMRGKRPRVWVAVLLAAALAALLWSACEIAALGLAGFWDSEYLFLLCLVIIPPGSFLLLDHAFGKAWKKTPALFLERTFRFDDAGVSVETSADALQSRTEYRWEALSRVCETKSAFYLYADGAPGLLVPKAGMDAQVAEKLSALLRGKAGSRYTLCYRPVRA